MSAEEFSRGGISGEIVSGKCSGCSCHGRGVARERPGGHNPQSSTELNFLRKKLLCLDVGPAVLIRVIDYFRTYGVR